jgi:2-polyprenyl-3-methyl-5-hydroxy-6-metoxy-1,4-benzoquinol methylase
MAFLSTVNLKNMSLRNGFFKTRSYQKELLDEPDIAPELLFQNLRELEFINTYLGGHRISLKGLETLQKQGIPFTSVIDIGCGGGDSLKAIARWQQRNKLPFTLTGIDLKPDCISFAKQNCAAHPEIKWLCDDFRNAFAQGKVDVVHASLFCHHFTEQEIVAFLKLCSQQKAIFVINDLERHPLAYYSIQWLTRLFSKSPLVKNDAPLSVQRGFKKKEWKAMLETAGIKHYIVRNYWAFRHLVIAFPN